MPFFVRFVITALTLAAAIWFASDRAHAQVPPYDYPRTVGTTSITVLPVNNARKRLLFYNPNAVAKIAVCPTTSRVDSSAIVCTIGGAGSITLLPYDRISLDGPVIGGGAAAIPSGWNAISDTPSSTLTILEYE